MESIAPAAHITGGFIDGQNKILTAPRQSVINATMPTRRHADDEEFSEATASAILAELRLMRQDAAANKPKLNGWTQPIMTGLVVFVAVFGVNFIPKSSGIIDQRLALIELKLDQADRKEQLMERETRLLQ